MLEAEGGNLLRICTLVYTVILNFLRKPQIIFEESISGGVDKIDSLRSDFSAHWSKLALFSFLGLPG